MINTVLILLAPTNVSDVVRMFYEEHKDERDFFSGKNLEGYRVAPDDCVALLQVIYNSEFYVMGICWVCIIEVMKRSFKNVKL